MVFYRKYRPQKVSELDLESVRERLSSILKQKEIPHAFLFTGSKGLGKTSTARILAKAINCQSKKEIEPCNDCEICTSITNGSNMDVLEIDAASNRGIDEIRELRERIKYAPAELLKKVYIIDEVHMLTVDAFNALLKTLEEPPTHAVFILCTTELDKVPSTIASRTFHITFKKPTEKEAVASLKRIVDGEKLEIEDGVLESILAFSEGSFRDATKILQELSIAAGGKKITAKTLEATYNSGNVSSASNDILNALSKKDAKSALSLISGLSENGADFKVVTETLVSMLHGLILKRFGFENDIQDIRGFTDKELNDLFAMLNDSYRNIKTSVLPQIPLEIAVVSWCLRDADEKVVKIEHSEKVTETVSVTIPTSPTSSEKSEEPKPANAESKSEKEGYGMFAKNALPENFFHALLDAVKRDNHSIAGILRGCKLIELGDDKVTFHARYKFHKDKLNEAKTVAILDKRASELLNRNIHVVVEMTAN